MKRMYIFGVAFVAMLFACSAPPARITVPDTDPQREAIGNAIGMIDGLDETATPAAVRRYAHQVVRSELISADKTIYDLTSRVRVCSVQLEDAMHAYDGCMAAKKDLESDYYDLKKEGGFFARLGLRWTWFFYGVGATIITLIVVGIVLYVTGWITRITTAVGGFRL